MPTEKGFMVRLVRSGRSFLVPPDSSILDVLLENGIDVEYSCRQGMCGACEVSVLGGEPDHRDTFLTEEEAAVNGTMLICCSRANTAFLDLDL